MSDPAQVADFTLEDPTPNPEPHEPLPGNLHKISLTGWVFFAIWATALITWAILDPEPYAQGWRLVLELMFLGHVLNAADGISSGFSNSYLLFQCGLQDVILVLIAYPWIVRAYQGMETRGIVRKTIDNFRRNAERHHKIVEPFGALGLWLFVFIPFWSSGALVGSIIGYLIGLRTRVIFAAVFSGHFLGVTTTVFFFDIVQDSIGRFNRAFVSYMPWVILTGIVIVSVINFTYKRIKKARSAE